jgi:hypothetical protein
MKEVTTMKQILVHEFATETTMLTRSYIVTLDDDETLADYDEESRAIDWERGPTDLEFDHTITCDVATLRLLLPDHDGRSAYEPIPHLRKERNERRHEQ